MKSEDPLRNHLRVIRTQRGLSQQDLARAAGITRQTIGGIEAGQYAPSAIVALRLARALGCRVEELFWLEGEQTSVRAARAAGCPSERVSLARVGARWVAHPLRGDAAFRSEMIPADGLATGAGVEVDVQVLEEPQNLARTVVLAGCTPAMSLWARAAERRYPGLRVHWTFANSMEALESVRRGEVHAAGLHLYDPATGEFNTPFVRRVLPKRTTALVNLGTWEEGLLVKPRGRRTVRRLEDLAGTGVVLANREEGSGARVVLDLALRDSGLQGASIQGYARAFGSHVAVAREVAEGRADVGVSAAAIAALYGLEFIPLREVRYDLAVPKEQLEHEPLRQLLGTLHDRWVRTQLNLLGGYDTRQTGEIVATT